MPDPNMRYYTCPDSTCPVVIYVDRHIKGADPKTANACPGDDHVAGDTGVLIEKDY